MTEHISTSRMELFSAQGLPETELAIAAHHVADCADCHQQFVATLRRQRENAELGFTLAPEFWFRHDHVDYEQLVELADKKLDAADLEVIDVHLKLCSTCREDVRSFLAFREQIAPELEIAYAPGGDPQPRVSSASVSIGWGRLVWKPIYAAAVIVIGIAIVIGAALLLKQRTENQQAKQVPTPQVSPGSTPDDRAATVLPPPSTPNESPIEKPNTGEAIVVLNDRGATITVDETGNVIGLDDVPNSTREQIAQVLLSERLEPPAILKDLRGQAATLRGSRNAQPFKLTYPSRTVIVSDQPTFKWESASGANSYRVYVTNPAGNEITKSEELPSDRTEWKLPKPLNRGGIYTWTVVAVVDGREVVSPGPSFPEMKFQVLPLSSLERLDQLKRAGSHLALGVFYAREGMISESEREFRILVRDNPDSQHAKKLLRQIQSWPKQ